MSLSLWNDSFFANPWSVDHMLHHFNDSKHENFWKPLADVKETDKEVVMHMELPGIKKENINIDVKDGVLTVSGERKEEKKTEHEKYHRTERSYGSFKRSMMLPKGITDKDIKASCQDGVLEVSFPRPEKSEVKKITVA